MGWALRLSSAVTPGHLGVQGTPPGQSGGSSMAPLHRHTRHHVPPYPMAVINKGTSQAGQGKEVSKALGGVLGTAVATLQGWLPMDPSRPGRGHVGGPQAAQKHKLVVWGHAQLGWHPRAWRIDYGSTAALSPAPPPRVPRPPPARPLLQGQPLMVTAQPLRSGSWSTTPVPTHPTPAFLVPTPSLL